MTLRASRIVTLLVTVGATACGRIDYDPVGDGAVDVPIDAAIAPIHVYHLNDLSDDLGGAPLISKGGTFEAGGYRYDGNHGLGLVDAVPAEVYTIDLVVTPARLGEFNKLLDYKLRATDEGLYTEDARLTFVTATGVGFERSDARLQVGNPYQITIARDAGNQVTTWIDGAMVRQFPDPGGVATLPMPGAALELFMDDDFTGGGEASYGVVRRILIFDVALLAAP